MQEHDLHRFLAAELGVKEGQVSAAVGLLDGGATVPFIARYRKEATGTLDDAQLGRCRSGSVTCAKWRSGGPRSSIHQHRASSTMRCKRGSWRRTPRPGSRTFTCRTSRSGGPGRSSRARRGLNPWPRNCWPTRQPTRGQGRGVRRSGRGESPTRRRRWPARRRSWPSGSPRTRTSRHAAGADVAARPAQRHRPGRPAAGRGQVRRLLRLPCTLRHAAVAPDPRPVPR